MIYIIIPTESWPYPLSGNDSSAQNDWKGAWWHSSFSVHSGSYTFVLDLTFKFRFSCMFIVG